MEWLNYHHLLYFWVVAREGSIAKASEQLRLAQPTISGQLRALEQSLGEKLFARSGRGLKLTETGQVVFRYAGEIFGTGQELMDVLKGRPSGSPVRFIVGVADVIPKLVAYRLLEPALHLPESVQIVCREDRTERLLAELSVHELDLVLSDAPIAPTVKVRAFSHLLGECGVTFFAAGKRAAMLRRNFPRSLDEAPFLLPPEPTTLRRSLEHWFDSQNIRPRLAGEFDDSALLKEFGHAGMGIFVVPSVIEAEVRRRYKVRPVGRSEQIRERFYAISLEKKIRHPAVAAMSETAHRELFS